MIGWTSVSQLAQAQDLNPSTIYRHIQYGLLPPPVALGPNTKRFPDFELIAVYEARLRGADDDAVRALVRELVAARQQVAA